MRVKDKALLHKISLKRFERNLRSERQKKAERRRENERNFIKNRLAADYVKRTLAGTQTYQDVLERWLPTNLRYLIDCPKSDFGLANASRESWFPRKKPSVSQRVLMVPQNFSIIDNPKESFEFLKRTTYYLLFGQYKTIDFSYENCEQLDIGAQVILDIILRDVISFGNKCRSLNVPKLRAKIPNRIGLTNLNVTRPEIKKILFSVGSPAVHTQIKFKTDDIIPYRLCVHNLSDDSNRLRAMEQKDIDTTELADYVVDSLKRVNKTLTPEKLENLCTIIGEVLINAEEHSTTAHRFSIGYFQDIQENGKHYGLFRLVIMNFGTTIYGKFSDPNCPNKEIVEKMGELSQKYTKSKWFSAKEFEEETLWTLYALQEGVTSVADKKRGNGSIQFIDSFFSIKGIQESADDKSRMTILSGNASITFDGTYRIQEKSSNGDKFKVMTFNESGSIEDKPNKDYVKFVNNYFPGTIISARILFHEDDFTENA